MPEPVGAAIKTFWPVLMSGQASAEATALRQRSSRGARRREASRLENTAQLLRKALGPAARDRCVIINEDVGTIVDWFAVEDRFYQNKRFPVLIPGGVRMFVVGAGELPIEKPDE